jgi:hypothetical protein
LRFAGYVQSGGVDVAMIAWTPWPAAFAPSMMPPSGPSAEKCRCQYFSAWMNANASPV